MILQWYYSLVLTVDTLATNGGDWGLQEGCDTTVVLLTKPSKRTLFKEDKTKDLVTFLNKEITLYLYMVTLFTAIFSMARLFIAKFYTARLSKGQLSSARLSTV